MLKAFAGTKRSLISGAISMNDARTARWPLVAVLILSAGALGQDRLPSPPPAASSSSASQPATVATPATGGTDQAAPAADEANFKPEELEQMLAAIALYPDSLLSQVLMASTYPIEVVEAERWMKANTQLKGDALAKELEKKEWDPSVRSLVNFPEVLTMMSENLTTTTKIGDAFIGQQAEVMETVQKLRAKAKEAGNLESNQQQNVTVQDSGGTQVIVVESSNPEVIYVPQYNPTVVYGSWPYPAYQPYPYYPPGYVASNVLSFGVGVACGVAWGYAWGNCNWGGNDIDIDIDRNTNINNNIDRSKYKNNGGRGSFKHDPFHRQGAAYRNQASANKVGAGNASNRATQARNDYRGRAEAGRSDISRGGADSFKNNSRAGGAGSTRAPQATPRTSGASGKGSALSDARGGGTAAKQASSRGSSSRQSSPSASRSSAGSRSSSGASRSGASRSGGSRGGGGRGGGGGGRR